jgi:hypothetical protein
VAESWRQVHEKHQRLIEEQGAQPQTAALAQAQMAAPGQAQMVEVGQAQMAAPGQPQMVAAGQPQKAGQPVSGPVQLQDH